MFVARAAKDRFLWMAQHRKVALPAFFAGLLVYLGLAAIWPKHYTATALAELNPEANGKSDPASQREAAAAAIHQATTPADWAAIVTRLHLYPETVADGRLDWAANYLASQVSIKEAEDAKHTGLIIRVDYTDSDGDTALGVAQAVADNLTRPVSLLTLGNLAAAASPPRANAAARPGVTPVARPLVKTRAKRMRPVRKESKRRRQNSEPDPELTRRLQAALVEGQTLQDAFNENAQTLSSLRQQIAVEDQRAAAAQQPQAVGPAEARKEATPKPDPRIEHLREELARAEQVLAGLQQRYTENYPDVVVAKDRVRDLLLDMSRLQAAASVSTKVQAAMPAAKAPVSPPISPAVRNELLRRLDESQAAEEKLQEDIKRNHAEVARLQSEVALSKNAAAQNVAVSDDGGFTASPSPPSPTTNQSTPLPMPEEPSSASLSSATPSGETTSPSSTVSPPPLTASTPISLAESATVRTSPLIFAGRIAWILSVALGCVAAFVAAWLADRRDPSIRSERMLRRELSPSTVFLGRIPRVRHETVPR